MPASAGDMRDSGSISGSGRSPEEGCGNPFSILAWRIPWTEEPGGLRSMGLERVRHEWSFEHATHLTSESVVLTNRENWDGKSSLIFQCNLSGQVLYKGKETSEVCFSHCRVTVGILKLIIFGVLLLYNVVCFYCTAK